MQNKEQKNSSAVSKAQIEYLLNKYSEEHNVSPQRVSKIMSEFVEGFEFLLQFKKAVSIYGSTRRSFKSNIYKEAYLLSYNLAKDGFTIITGGGSGIMEAANKGAYKAGGKSVGINITLKHQQKVNQYVTDYKEFEHFFVRRVMLAFASQIYIFFPGGFGTLDEFFEMLVLVQTEETSRIPIILVNKSYWGPLVTWFEKHLYKKDHAISKKDLQIYYLVDDANEAYHLIKELMKKKKVPL